MLFTSSIFALCSLAFVSARAAPIRTRETPKEVEVCSCMVKTEKDGYRCFPGFPGEVAKACLGVPDAQYLCCSKCSCNINMVMGVPMLPEADFEKMKTQPAT